MQHLPRRSALGLYVGLPVVVTLALLATCALISPLVVPPEAEKAGGEPLAEQ